MEVRAPTPDEGNAWLRLRQRLWPDHPVAELRREQAEIRGNPARNAVFVAADESGALEGFVEVSLRDYAEGCDSSPVGYIEGWYVEPHRRRSGVGRELVAAAERWAQSRGCTEMGSDARLENELSHRAHEALGYAEVERLVVFRKPIRRG